MSQRELLVAKACELLRAALPSVHVHRSPMLPLEKDKLPAISVYQTLNKCTDQSPSQGMREYDLDLRVEARATGDTEACLDAFLDQVRRVMLLDPFLGGLALRVKEGEIQYDALSRDRIYWAAAADFTVRYYEDPSPVADEAWGLLKQLDYLGSTP